MKDKGQTNLENNLTAGFLAPAGHHSIGPDGPGQFLVPGALFVLFLAVLLNKITAKTFLHNRRPRSAAVPSGASPEVSDDPRSSTVMVSAAQHPPDPEGCPLLFFIQCRKTTSGIKGQRPELHRRPPYTRLLEALGTRVRGAVGVRPLGSPRLNVTLILISLLER